MTGLSLKDPDPTELKMLDYFDRARSILTAALESTRVEVVLAGRDELDHIKLRARQIRDRALLADATEFQMRIERHLGFLLRAAREAGHLASQGGRAKAEAATLHEVGVDRKLSMNAQHAAGLGPQAFDASIADMRERLSGAKAKIVSVVGGTEKRSRHSPRARRDCYGFPLADGTPLGQVKIGKIRSRIDGLAIELKILQAISDRSGMVADALASVEDTISAAALDTIINEAKSEH